MTHPEKRHAQDSMHRIAEEKKQRCVQSYFLALREPTTSLTCDPNRPEVATAAILGYN
ncbi:hypothetical protein [Paraburkholderia hospita]|uniref:hypothetical protein n=1 Tax=Paraburkholderia hospita TaxID=169430 RepID=UPI0013F172E8|nr:hypothetical protein [Paraburkholderia hospita]